MKMWVWSLASHGGLLWAERRSQRRLRSGMAVAVATALIWPPYATGAALKKTKKKKKKAQRVLGKGGKREALGGGRERAVGESSCLCEWDFGKRNAYRGNLAWETHMCSNLCYPFTSFWKSLTSLLQVSWSWVRVVWGASWPQGQLAITGLHVSPGWRWSGITGSWKNITHFSKNQLSSLLTPNRESWRDKLTDYFEKF